ncbi:MAG: ACT domain-containing protein [Candidatus Peribacteraceae bacterium]|nr:ACT domain-containing protein [Candidatus Peribacteraceae bacterium]
MVDDVYAQAQARGKHTERYLLIVVRNVIGVVNRITCLLRRRRYKMEDISVSFDDRNRTHIVIAMDGEKHDIEQVMHQIEKLHDVLTVSDITRQHGHFFQAFYVDGKSDEDLRSINSHLLRIASMGKAPVGVFMVPISESAEFEAKLRSAGRSFRRRLIATV